MIAAIDGNGANIDYGVTGKHPALQRLFDPLLHRGDELPRNCTAFDLIHELKALTPLQGLKLKPDMAILTPTTGLLDEPALHTNGHGDGLFIGHLGPAHLGLHIILAHHAVDNNLKMKLAHPRDYGLAGILVIAYVKSGGFFSPLG